MDWPLIAREMYPTKRRCVLLGEGGGECPTAVFATLTKNIEPLGFTLSRAPFDRLRTHTVDPWSTPGPVR